jgi:hypothetical protein
MKRGVDDSATDSGELTMVVRGRYLRLGTASSSWERTTAPKHTALEVSELGFTAASDWATSRILSGRMTPQTVKDRALLMVSDVQCVELLNAASALALEAGLPDSLGGNGACLAENVYVAGNATATTLCVGDVLVVVGTAKRRRRTATARDSDPPHDARLLRLQVSSPCLPCSKVDQRLGRTWGGRGVRAHAARTGTRGWFARVLTPGALRDGDRLAVCERPNPAWPLARVADLLYNMDGVCDVPGSYRFPAGAEVAARWRGSQAQLRELATLPELAGFEWRDEAVKMLAAWEAAEARRSCAIL